jgi:hypothetical protein
MKDNMPSAWARIDQIDFQEKKTMQLGPLLLFLFLLSACLVVSVPVAQPAKSAARLPGADLCTICKFFVSSIEGYLAENLTETEIVKLLGVICAVLPATDRPACDHFLQNEVPALIQYIIKTESPMTACAEFGFCP